MKLIALEITVLDVFYGNNLRLFNLWVVNVMNYFGKTYRFFVITYVFFVIYINKSENDPWTYTFINTTKHVTYRAADNTNSSKAGLKFIDKFYQKQATIPIRILMKINLLVKGLFTSVCHNFLL